MGSACPKALSVRTHVCPSCGLVLDRDENAAQQHPMGRAGPSGTRGITCGGEPSIHRALARVECQGKLYATDAATAATMLRIVQSVPSPKAEPVKQWLALVGAQRLDEVAASLDEDQRRQLLRGEVATKNSHLADTVAGAGIVTTRDFAIFQDWGYRGLYNGEKARDIAARKGLAPASASWTGWAARSWRRTGFASRRPRRS